MTHQRKNPGACQRRGSVTAVLPQCFHTLKPTALRRSRQGCRMPADWRDRMRDLIEGGP